MLRRYFYASTRPVPLFVKSVFGEILGDVLAEIRRQLVPKTSFFEWIPDIDVSVVLSYDASPDRSQHAIVLSSFDRHMKMPRAALLTLGHRDVLKILDLSKSSTKCVEILLQPHFIRHVFPVSQRDHSIRTNRLAAKAHLLLRTLRGIHEVLLGVLRFAALGAWESAEPLCAHVSIEPCCRNLDLPISEIAATNHPFPAKRREIPYTFLMHCNLSL
ncbi:hypothetical protein WJ70_25130 [Burkholderia ubonensis]|nr:hypothetical protein WJ70_25130 [Burkholderia ubonensis]